MDMYHKILTGGCLILATSGIVMGVSWAKAIEAGARADERAKATKEALATSAQQQKERDLADAAYKAQVATQLADMAKSYNAVRTAPPQQQAAWSQDQLKEALKGIQISVNPTTGVATAIIPKESVADLPAVIEKCKECSVKLDEANHNLISKDQTIESLKTDKILLVKDNDELKTALKGGTFFHRFKKTILTAACAGGGAGVGAGAVSTNKAKGAAIGAVAAVIACDLASK